MKNLMTGMTVAIALGGCGLHEKIQISDNADKTFHSPSKPTIWKQERR